VRVNWRLVSSLTFVLLGYFFGGLAFHAGQRLLGLGLLIAGVSVHTYAYARWPFMERKRRRIRSSLIG